jgi:hypothetical protein
MADDRPYISVVVTARNDDHGGNLLGRMQAFVNGWIGQSKRRGLASELIFVEWNPPEGRQRLVDALHWPKDLGACRVRIIQVPPDLHRRYAHAEALPLYQMIAKNAGIRRARGRFVLATNIDIVFSDELVGFLAERKLETRRMYRIDRHDVMPDVPIDGIEEQLAYCRTHLIRINAREGTFNLTPDGRRAPNPGDIAAVDSGITFGPGWFPVERASTLENFRWVTTCSELQLAPPSSRVRHLRLDMEPGPGAGKDPLEVLLMSAKGEQFAIATVYSRGMLRVPVEGIAGEEPFVIRFRVLNGGRSIPLDTRILEFRVFRCDWDLEAQGEPITPPPLETQTQECECDAETQAEPVTPPPLEIQTQECDCDVENQAEPIAQPSPEIQTQECDCDAETQAEPIAPPPPEIQTPEYDWDAETREQPIGQSSIPVGRAPRPPSLWARFQLFLEMVAYGEDIILVPVAVSPRVKRALRFYVDNGGFTGLLRHGIKRSEIVPASTPIDATPSSAISANQQQVQLHMIAATPPVEISADPQPEPPNTVAATPPVEISADPQPEPLDPIAATPPSEISADPPPEPPNTVAATPLIEIPANTQQAQLHTNGCGDFTLMALENWLDLRGYPEFDTFSMHLDSVFCFSAHYSGVVEEILEEPMRIYHIEHGTGSGWTPEGQAKLFARIAERGLAMIENPEVIGWAKQMQKLRRPMIFNLENWGLVDFALPETTVASEFVKSV